MRYKSNLDAADLAPYFHFADPPRQNMTHDEPHDPDFDNPPCGSWTHDEAAILYNVALAVGPGHCWLDLGSRLGWTAAHILCAASSFIDMVDMEYRVPAFAKRAEGNIDVDCECHELWPMKTEEFLASYHVIEYESFTGVVIDADHDPPQPWRDAMGSLRHLNYDCVIMMHDCLLGLAVRDAMRHLIDGGFRCRFYWTPNGVACLWRGLPDFRPPDHVSDPALAVEFAKHRANMVDFAEYWSKCE